MNILGISCFFHDSAAAAIEDGRIVFAIQEERLSRRKHDPSLPVNAIGAALQAAGWEPRDVDRVVFYEDPDLKLQRIREQIERFRPESRYLEERALPHFLQHKYPVAALLNREFGFGDRVTCSEHHLSHAASSFYTSPFERALVVTIDGVGESESAAVYLGEGNTLRKMRSVQFPDSLGLFYSVFTQYLGFEVNEGEYKVMGLAPYGRPTYLDAILGKVLHLDDGGGFRLNLEYFDFCGTERHYRDRLVEHLGVPPRERGAPISEAQQNLAASVQTALELAVLHVVGSAVRAFDCTDVCMAGGVALNCTANARAIRDLGIRLHIHAAAGDAGGALGAALLEAARHETALYRPAFSPYLGVRYDRHEVDRTLAGRGLPHSRSGNVAAEIARRLAAGEVVAIAQGRDEWGPRALGARSILADPRRAEMKEHLNAKIKFREEFRPFAPVVLEHRYSDYFETLGMSSSPHMLFTHKARRPNEIAAVVHADSTSRVQTVNAEQNRYLYDIIREFDALTGVPVVINTSFNLRGEPIVSTPADALKTFLASGIDCLALDGCLVTKTAADRETDTVSRNRHAVQAEWSSSSQELVETIG